MLRVDNQLLSDVEKCDAAGIARHVLGLREKKKSIIPDIGNVFHAGLERHFRGGGLVEVMRDFDQAYDKVVKPGEQPKEPQYGKVNCQRIMQRYCEIRPVEMFPFVPVEFEEVVGTELTAGVMFYGKRDLRVRDKVTGLHSPLDHKTRHGEINGWWMKKFRMLSQLSGYCWLEQQISGEPCLEAYVNALEIKKIPDSSRRCRVHGCSYEECGIEHIGFELLTYARKQEMIDAWKNDAIFIAERFSGLREAFPSVEYLPFARRNGAFGDSCTFCEFKEWCSTGFAQDGMWEFVAEEKWEPWGEGKKGFEKLMPGTQEWMDYWKANPVDQEAMAEWCQRG